MAWLGSLVWVAALLGLWASVRAVYGPDLVVGHGVRVAIFVSISFSSTLFAYLFVLAVDRANRSRLRVRDLVRQFRLAPTVAGLLVLLIGLFSFTQIENVLGVQAMVFMAGIIWIYTHFVCYRLTAGANQSASAE